MPPRREQPSRDVQRLAVTLNIAGMDELIVLFRTLVTKADTISQKLDAVMAISTETRAVIDRLNAATNKIAERLTKLAEQIAAGGMSAADEAAAVAELNALAGNLEGMGTDPANPIPPEPPVTPVP